ncbi:hypothetical protein E8E12_005587 [Didymella heteroderae]|uniref:DUF6536 domain-containing protein n=1 Tax=Didymella heteroderae TaxID=1769908 RepID=A0A9P4X0U9_9PLEO|nr:hypothetical protein E8E12_005587 [Didymella heteroderae]
MHGSQSPKTSVVSKYAPLRSDIELSNIINVTERAWDISDTSPTSRWTHVSLNDLRQGWRFGASLGFLTCLSVLILNLSLTIWATTRSNSNNGHIFQGSCAAAKRYNMGLHLVINVLSTLLLGASNYSMQCLSAPTRGVLDRAHRKGKWLDVGVQSFRNLKWSMKWKKAVWTLLGLSSLPIHLLYNSVFYATITNNDYELYFASRDWLNGSWYDSWNLPAPGTVRSYHSPTTNERFNWTPIYETDPAELLKDYQTFPANYEHLDIDGCIDAYANTYLSDRRNVVLLSPSVPTIYALPSAYVEEIERVEKDSSLHWVIFSSDQQELYNKLDRYGWMCDNWDRGVPACTKERAREYAAHNNWTIFGWPVSGCVSQKLADKCSVNFHLGIAIVVVLANFGKAICIAAVCFFLSDQPLLTTGDAVSSFLRESDPTTVGCCLLDRKDICSHWRDAIRSQKRLPLKAHFPHIHRRWQAPGWKSWASFLLFFIICLIVVGVLLRIGIHSMDDPSFSTIRALGFGTATAEMVINDWGIPVSGSGALLQNVLVANTPQLLFSSVYLTLNNVLTRVHLAVEWASYLTTRKGLRVSHNRKGAQRSTYFLQLPYRVGVPLMAISASLHWLISQSIFLVSIETYDVNGLPKNGRSKVEGGLDGVNEEHIATCGYSPLAIICLLVVSGLVVIYVVGMGFKKLPSDGMPLVGSNSVGIAAACHPPQDGGDAQHPLMWGVVSESSDEGIGHCSFSSSAVSLPVQGQLHA